MEGSTHDSYHEATITDIYGSSRTLRVPVVQELVRHGIQTIPKIFIKPDVDSTTSVSLDHFPSVSLAKLRAMRLEDRTRELEKLATGAREWGMLLVYDHGIPASLLDHVKGIVKGFFGLSIDQKRKSVGTYASTDNMGYGRNYVKSQDQIFEWVDRLTMIAAPKGSTDGLDVWPRNPPNFRDIMERYAEEARNVGDQILEALAEALSLEKDRFLRYFDRQTSEIKVRINYYPPCPNPNLTLGLNPHSDPSALSVLIQMDNSGGLQVMHKDESVWQTIPWPTDAVLVTVGDLLEIMSNRRVISGLHRVITQPDVERLSVALFYLPAPTTEIEPVEKDQTGDVEYKKVVVGDYIKHYYKVSPAYGKQTTLSFAKV
ncbi:protein LATERAL BRANCHING OXIDOREDUCTASE 1-like [Silene latifolia]|uniref:protein LATERAL BRANCHING OXIDOREDUCTASE 1-like n=1 Tax=Silene latifolia TaxID=37657 RepID=UPI003D76B2B8